MKKRSTFSIGLLSTLALTFLLGPITTAAQTGLLIRTPAQLGGFTYEFFLKEGESACDSFIVQHDFEDQESSRTFYTMVSDLEIDPETGRSVYPKRTLILDHKFSLASWVSVSTTEVTLDKWGDQKDVNFCVTVPAGAAPGTHFANIFMSNLKVEEFLAGTGEFEDVSGAAIGSRAGVNVLVTVAGDLDPNIDILDLRITDIDHNSGLFNIFEYLPINVVADLSNSGNQFIKPAGNISIHTGNLAEPLAFMRFNENGIRVLPGAKASFSLPWDDAPLYIYKNETRQDGGGTVYDNRLGINLEKLPSFRFGRYFATLQMSYTDSDGKRQLAPEYTIQFWIIPWKLIILIILIIAGLVVGYKKLGGGSAQFISKQRSGQLKRTARK